MATLIHWLLHSEDVYTDLTKMYFSSVLLGGLFMSLLELLGMNDIGVVILGMLFLLTYYGAWAVHQAGH